MSGCPHCQYMPFDPGHEPRLDRNGMSHHPYCLTVGRDEWADRILCAAWELAHHSRGERSDLAYAARVRRLVLQYDVWREQRGLKPMRFERQVRHLPDELRSRNRAAFGDEWAQEELDFGFPDEED